MARGRKHTPEQVVNLLRQIEVAVANGKTTAQSCKEAEITEQTYYRWRKEYGGLQVDQARRLKELEQENAKLKRLVSDLSIEKLVLKDIASGNVWSAPFLQAQRCFGSVSV
jgi:hypothetical protein